MENEIQSTNLVTGIELLAKNEGLELEEFSKFILQKFFTQLGRYESSSGNMFFELEHCEQGVKWRKGVTGDPQLLEDEILELPAAIERFFGVMQKGYTRVFSAATADDFIKESNKLKQAESAIQREGLLGIYLRDKEFFRVNEYSKNVFSFERGYDDMIISSKYNLSEAEIRTELDSALAIGFSREQTNQTNDFDLSALMGMYG